jgi:hypothetical protein
MVRHCGSSAVRNNGARPLGTAREIAAQRQELFEQAQAGLELLRWLDALTDQERGRIMAHMRHVAWSEPPETA